MFLNKKAKHLIHPTEYKHKALTISVADNNRDNAQKEEKIDTVQHETEVEETTQDVPETLSDDETVVKKNTKKKKTKKEEDNNLVENILENE